MFVFNKEEILVLCTVTTYKNMSKHEKSLIEYTLKKKD